MNRTYSHPITILPSVCDATARLSVPGAFSLFMDVATEHADALGISMRQIGAKGLFWLTVRTRIRFYKRPGMLESAEITTFPEDPGKLRCNRDYVLSQNGKILIEGKTEWAILETQTGKLHTASDIFPGDLTPEAKPVWDEPFSRISDDFSAAEAFGTYTVQSTDIDLGGHMNNAAYIRAIASLYPCEQWNAMEIREMEAVYRAPCFEGDLLRVYRRQAENITDLRMANAEDQTVLLARIITA